MSTARIDSIDVLKALRTALIKFGETANIALGDAEGEMQHMMRWVEMEQTTFWSSQVRKRHEMVERCKEAVRMKKLFKDSTGGKGSAIDEEKALAKAMRALAEAEAKLVAVKRWARALPREVTLYQGAVSRFASSVSGDVPQAVAQLEHMMNALNAYVSLAAPPGGEVPTGGQGGAASMGQTGGGVIAGGRGQTLDDPVDMSEFPRIDEPKVALVHADRESGLLVTAEGGRFPRAAAPEQAASAGVPGAPPAEGAASAAAPAPEAAPAAPAAAPAEKVEKYRVFDSIEAARDYAREKVKENPQLECMIYDASARELLVISPTVSEAGAGPAAAAPAQQAGA